MDFSTKTAEERADEVCNEVSIRPAEERLKHLLEAKSAIKNKTELMRQLQQETAEQPVKQK